MNNWRTFCTRLREHPAATGLFLALVTLVLAVLSLCVGAVAVSPAQVLRALLTNDPADVSARVVLYSRLPRTCGSLLAGAALAVSGVIIQTVLANPLASPNVIGINAGAGAAVALCCALAPMAVGLTPIAAFGGAFGSAMLVLAVSQRAGASRMTLILTGVALSSIFSAAVDLVVTLVPDALNGYSDFRVGGLGSVTMARVIPAAAVGAVCLAGLLLLTNELDVLALGTETARSLGLQVGRMRVIVLALAAGLAGAAVSVAGLIGFVGLIVPHLIRRFLGEESRPLILGCALGGAALLTFCDTAARTLFAPYEIPVGVALSLGGGPFFIWLVLHQKGGRRR